MSHNDDFKISGEHFEHLRFFLIWVIFHSLSYWFMNWLIPKFGIANLTSFLYFLLMGLGITILAKIMRGLLHKEDFYINKYFLSWVVINTLGFYLLTLIIPELNIVNQIINLLLFGVGLTIVGKIGKMIRLSHSHYSFEFPDLETILGILVIAFIASFFIYLPYKETSLSSNYYCADGTVNIRNSLFGLGEMEAATSCLEYKSSKCVYMCTDEKPVCECQAKVFDQVFHSPGDWVLDAWS